MGEETGSRASEHRKLETLRMKKKKEQNLARKQEEAKKKQAVSLVSSNPWDITDKYSVNDHDPDLNATLNMLQRGNGFNNTKASGNMIKEDNAEPIIKSLAKYKPKKKGVSILYCNKAARP